MDLNSRINWTPGMEITAQTFIGLEQQIDLRQQIALRAALGNSQMGLLPGAKTNCQGVFVANAFEMEHLQCLGILPSGRIVNVDERVEVPIPMLYGSLYYLTVGIGDGMTEFERDGVSYLRPKYVYAIQTREEMEAGDVLPLVRFSVSQGVFSVDSDFILPCLLLSGDQRFSGFIEKYVKAMECLTDHPNLVEGDGKRTLLRFLFHLKGIDYRHSVQELVMLTQELVQAIDYFIVRPNGAQPLEIPRPSKGDIRIWLDWVDSCLTGAVAILDKVVLEDNTIDYDALLAQAKRELYEQLHPELLEKLVIQTKEELHQEMQQLTDTLSTYVKDTLKKELSDQFTTDIDTRTEQMDARLKEDMDKLSQNLEKSLYDKLFDDVYLGVYNVLHDEEVSDFVPLI